MNKNPDYQESDIYNSWIQNKLHSYQNSSLYQYHFLPTRKDNKYIPMPPPNITGRLHMGHALFLTLQDGIHRYYKNLGIKSLWLPGLDHAGLATYEKIEQYQKENNSTYLDSAQYIASSHKEIILSQMQKIGSLPDWDLLTYTLSDSYQEFILKILKLCYEQNRLEFKDGQIYLHIQDLALELANDLRAGEFKIYPEYEIKNLMPFLDNMEPWNISRQIPWGTPLPFKLEEGKIIWSEEGGIGGCLDTWFNSSLYPLAALAQKPELIKDFYPAELIETGADILFFWCAKMLMMSNLCFKHQQKIDLKLPDKYAFRTIYLHGLIRDKHGRKFSKSLGNGIDPLDMIAKYGSDATRLFLATRSGPSEDILFNENDLHIYKKFINKIWNSARFFSMYAQKIALNKLDTKPIISDMAQKETLRIQTTFQEYMDSYQLLQASRFIHSEFKSWFCDKWIEENKQAIQTGDKAAIEEGIFLLDQLLACLGIFCPYLADNIKNQFWSY